MIRERLRKAIGRARIGRSNVAVWDYPHTVFVSGEPVCRSAPIVMQFARGLGDALPKKYIIAEKDMQKSHKNELFVVLYDKCDPNKYSNEEIVEYHNKISAELADYLCLHDKALANNEKWKIFREVTGCCNYYAQSVCANMTVIVKDNENYAAVSLASKSGNYDKEYYIFLERALALSVNNARRLELSTNDSNGTKNLSLIISFKI